MIILKPIYTWLIDKWGIRGSKPRATAITILIFVLIIGIPAVIIIGGAITQAAYLFSGLNLEGLDFSGREINGWLENTIQTIVAGNINLDEFRFADNLSQAIAWFSQWLMGILVSLGQSLPRIVHKCSGRAGDTVRIPADL